MPRLVSTSQFSVHPISQPNVIAVAEAIIAAIGQRIGTSVTSQAACHTEASSRNGISKCVKHFWKVVAVVRFLTILHPLCALIVIKLGH